MPTNYHDLTDDIAPRQPELVFALVGWTGADLTRVETRLAGLLKQYGYSAWVSRLSDMVQEFAELKNIRTRPEYQRIRSLQRGGNRIRREARRGDALALRAIARIHQKRMLNSAGQPQALPRVAHILKSLKHPEEVQTLRRVYGLGFFLIGVHASQDEKLKYLTHMMGMSCEEAIDVMTHDESEEDENYGQQTRKTFYLADVFIRQGDDEQLRRFLKLVFGAPFETPTPDEHSMFLAFAASLRSAQPGRQVGAVVVSKDGDVIGTGANDVPRYGGGLYWSSPPEEDQRDHRYDNGIDSNKIEIAATVSEIATVLKPLLRPNATERRVRTVLRHSRLHNITEFGRAVHAEMEALLACARIGVSVRGGRLFTTTFPCHNCAKHIVDSGINQVIFVEPYPKSRAAQLHKDSIAVDEPAAVGRVLFLPYVGVAARRYFDLFSMGLNTGIPLNRRDYDEPAKRWAPGHGRARNRMSPFSYIGREKKAILQIPFMLRRTMKHS